MLRHIGLLAGTALIAGAGGTALFGILGLALSVPMLLRLRRRYASWWAPAIGLAVFAVMFSLSAFVIGPPSTQASRAAASPRHPSITAVTTRDQPGSFPRALQSSAGGRAATRSNQAGLKREPTPSRLRKACCQLRGGHRLWRGRKSQRAGRSPSMVIVTSRRTAAAEGMLLAAVRAWRQ